MSLCEVEILSRYILGAIGGTPIMFLISCNTAESTEVFSGQAKGSTGRSPP